MLHALHALHHVERAETGIQQLGAERPHSAGPAGQAAGLRREVHPQQLVVLDGEGELDSARPAAYGQGHGLAVVDGQVRLGAESLQGPDELGNLRLVLQHHDPTTYTDAASLPSVSLNPVSELSKALTSGALAMQYSSMGTGQPEGSPA